MARRCPLRLHFRWRDTRHCVRRVPRGILRGTDLETGLPTKLQPPATGATADLQIRFLPLAVKTVICHTVTYFVMGVLAFHFLHYADLFNKPNSGLRPMTDPLIVFGPALQMVRGVLFATVFYPLREILFGRWNGWLLAAWMLIGIGILGTFAAPPGSVEGFIYTTVPIRSHVRGYLEIVPQALLLSVLLYYWVRHPGKAWLNWVLGVAYSICVLLPMVGLLAPKR